MPGVSRISGKMFSVVKERNCELFSIQDRGGSRVFILGGGGVQKIMCPHAHYERGTKLTSAGVQARLRALKALYRVVLMLSRRAIWALFLSILIKNWIRHNIVDQMLGCRTCCAPLWIRHCRILSWFYYRPVDLSEVTLYMFVDDPSKCNNNNNNNNSSYKAHNTAIASLCAGKEKC